MFSKREELDPEDYYLSEAGYLVFTEKYLLKRGYCCKNGCKHCPYGFDKKTQRINKKDSNQNSNENNSTIP
jgi:hypothetical protein